MGRLTKKEEESITALIDTGDENNWELALTICTANSSIHIINTALSEWVLRDWSISNRLQVFQFKSKYELRGHELLEGELQLIGLANNWEYRLHVVNAHIKRYPVGEGDYDRLLESNIFKQQ